MKAEGKRAADNAEERRSRTTERREFRQDLQDEQED
jgi:hypothetical protein